MLGVKPDAGAAVPALLPVLYKCNVERVRQRYREKEGPVYPPLHVIAAVTPCQQRRYYSEYHQRRGYRQNLHIHKLTSTNCLIRFPQGLLRRARGTLSPVALLLLCPACRRTSGTYS